MKRKYFNDSSICWRIIGETVRSKRNVRAAGRVQSEPSKRWEKSHGKPLIGRSSSDSADSIKQFLPMLFLPVCLVVGPNCWPSWVQKFLRLSDYCKIRTGQRLCTKANTGWSIHTARSWLMETSFYHDLLYMSVKKMGTYDYEKYEYVKPWLQKADLALGRFLREPLTELLFVRYPLNAERSRNVPAIKDAGYDAHGFGT